MNLYNPAAAPMPRMQADKIRAAYKTAGLEAPVHNAAKVRELILAAPSVDQVAGTLALEAFDTDKPEQFVKAAVKTIEQAMAGEALKQAYLAAEPGALQAVGPGLTAAAARDLTPYFNRQAQALTEAAGALDRDRPLDPEAAVSTDTGAHLTTVRTILPKLSVLASIHSVTKTDASPALNKLLPIITIPEVVAEQVEQTLATKSVVINPKDSASARMIRDLSKVAQDDIDLAIIQVARGDYPGIELNLLIPRESEPRAARVGEAFRQITVRNGQRITFN